MKLRPPAVAGSFYPAEATVLQRQIDGFLSAGDATSHAIPGDAPTPKVLLVPHAGTRYSGRTAGIAYVSLRNGRSSIRRVVLLGPTHRVSVHGLAVSSADAFDTPLGPIPLDLPGRDAVLRLPQVVLADAPHAQEHSLELQLPFLQRALDHFSLLPLAVGRASPEAVAEVLDLCWGGDETLIVISSDLSHFLPYREAQKRDRQTVEAILGLTGPLDHEQACGATPLNGLLLAARSRGLRPTLLDLCNSGDAPGNTPADQNRVVGYAALRFDQPAPEPTAATGTTRP